MKFGSSLQRNQVPEWSSEYINYKGLKKLIKAAALDVKLGHDADLAEFFYSLDRNLETVDGFYNKKYAEASRRLKLMSNRYGSNTHFRHGGTKEEIDDTIGSLLELRSQLRKLQWYAEVNRRGFTKILKKLDKKVPSSNTQQRYLQSRVEPRPFATNTSLAADTTTVNLWLSRLGDLRPVEDSDSTDSPASLSRTTSATMMNKPKEVLDIVEHAVKHDQAEALAKTLDEIQEVDKEEAGSSQRFLLHVLQRAVSCFSKKCIAELLSRLDSLDDEDDINRRNCLHRLAITIARASASQAYQRNSRDTARNEALRNIVPAEAPNWQATSYAAKEVDSSLTLSSSDSSLVLLEYILDHLKPSQRAGLIARDNLRRMPLHYAAQHGVVVLCETIISRMRTWGQYDTSQAIDSSEWQDEDGNSPLHLSVIGGYPSTAQCLLDSACVGSEILSAGSAGQKPRLCQSGHLLTMATKASFVKIVKILVAAGADINYQDEGGETAMHAAARFGHRDAALALLETKTDFKLNLELEEKTFGWTPLQVASVDGHLAMVELLVEAGADVNKRDVSGWTAKEHAALRGHLTISALLAKHSPLTPQPEATPRSGLATPSGDTRSMGDRSSNGNGKDARNLPPVKSFGHRYLRDESLVLVSLGSMDHRKNIKPVQLDNIPLADAHATQLDTALSVVVSATGAHGEPSIIDLPVQENISTEPTLFTTKDAANVKVLFDIVPTYSGSKDQVVGRGVALLSSIKTTLGSKRMNLQGDISVPIIAAKTLDFIGTVNFNFNIINPFSHPNMSINEGHTYWKSLTQPMVIGHRGMGKNMATRKSLQLGENTIQSFVAAANLGASYVEFDVQLTKDHVPVIYHDFLVSETGIDAPVHTLTLEQFLHINEAQTPRPSRPASPDDSITAQRSPDLGAVDRRRQRERAHSLGAQNSTRSVDMPERMKHTRDFKMKGFKGNSRGNFIQAPFTTLEEMLRKLPSHIGFNIEMKYPMLWESEEQEMDTYAVELNSFVDTVLKMVYDLGNNRDFIFSSFNPDICLLLSFKQPSIPVMFLTDAGASEVGDIRASSLQEAIRFASRWNLLGVVTAAEPLVTCPRLVRVVKESGLVCVSYGTLNNDPANVKLQVSEGIDAVIVDSVLAIRKGLTHAPATDATVEAVNGNGDAKGSTVNGVQVGNHQHSAVV